MLILTRRYQEDVVLTMPDGREIIVGVARIEGDRVRLGFDAPKDVKIVRRELTKKSRE